MACRSCIWSHHYSISNGNFFRSTVGLWLVYKYNSCNYADNHEQYKVGFVDHTSTFSHPDTKVYNPFMNTNLIKTIYFYLVMAGCVLSLSIGSYWLIRSNLIKYVFPEADDYYYGMSTTHRKPGFYDCQSYLNLPFPSETAENNVPKEPVLTEEQIKECKVLMDEETRLNRERRYQNDMISSILMVTIAGIVLGIHLKFVKLDK